MSDSSNPIPRGMPAAPAAPHRVGMLVYPDAQLLDIAGPMEVFARAARWLGDRRGFAVPAYTVELIAVAPGAVATSSGLTLLARHGIAAAAPCDTLLVTGGIGYARVCEDAAALAWIAAQAPRVARLGSICTGALILAAAGVLDQRAATTHWAYLDLLAQRAPTCRVDRDALYVRSGHVYTSAGVTAGIDLALALLEQDWGRTTAVAVAQELVVYRRRSARQAQFSRFLEAERRDDRCGRLQLWILDHLGEELPVERLAVQAAMSPRHFSRWFKARAGLSPAAFVLKLRVEEACRRLDEGALQLKEIARQCGFADEQNLRRAFQRQLGVLPQQYRRRP